MRPSVFVYRAFPVKASGQAVFGKRKESHTVIIARGEDIRHFVVRPWMIAFAGSALAAIAVGYLGATTYLVLRDDLLGAATARQARMQHAYEDRISALRAQVDRITSRQLLDQQLMEDKVAQLLDRQRVLSRRDAQLAPMLDRAGAPEAATPDAVTLPIGKPQNSASADAGGFSLASLGEPDAAGLASFWPGPSKALPEQSTADHADKLFVSINQSLESIEARQLAQVESLADNAFKKANAISSALQEAGLPAGVQPVGDAVGGPLIPVSESAFFENQVAELDQALHVLDAARQTASRLPIGNPLPGRTVTSSFGVRADPLLGSPALHSGIDFRAPLGAPAVASAAGEVTKAGWNGGYGRMVEIDHGRGYVTRYAHLNQIDVEVGQDIEKGQVIGQVGSSGRSTGPHLHYEVRHNAAARNPAPFLKVGKTIEQLL